MINLLQHGELKLVKLKGIGNKVHFLDCLIIHCYLNDITRYNSIPLFGVHYFYLVCYGQFKCKSNYLNYVKIWFTQEEIFYLILAQIYFNCSTYSCVNTNWCILDTILQGFNKQHYTAHSSWAAIYFVFACQIPSLELIHSKSEYKVCMSGTLIIPLFSCRSMTRFSTTE